MKPIVTTSDMIRSLLDGAVERGSKIGRGIQKRAKRTYDDGQRSLTQLRQQAQETGQRFKKINLKTDGPTVRRFVVKTAKQGAWRGTVLVSFGAGMTTGFGVMYIGREARRHPVYTVPKDGSIKDILLHTPTANKLGLSSDPMARNQQILGTLAEGAGYLIMAAVILSHLEVRINNPEAEKKKKEEKHD